MIIKGCKKGLSGDFKVPGDKSITHRGIMLGALGEGTTRITGILKSKDIMRTIDAFKKMGVKIEQYNDSIIVEGVGIRGLKKPNKPIDCGNSGTTIRLLSGVLVGQRFPVKLTGDESLMNRPMDRIIAPLKDMGACIRGKEDRYPPLEIKPTNSKIRGINYRLPIASAQVKSAILLASLFIDGKTSIIETRVSRDHTERMLNYYNCPVNYNGGLITMDPSLPLIGNNIDVPGDISSAAFFIVAATLIRNSNIIIRNVGVNPTRTGIIKVLREMGADIRLFNKRHINNESRADIQVRHSVLKGTTISEDIIATLIDEIPILAVAASLSQGRTLIKGAEELKYKETNRKRTIYQELKKMGVRIWELPDGLIIEGARFLKAAELYSHDDHRIAMALSIAALNAKGSSEIRGHECVNISYPNFFNTIWELLA